MFWLGVLCGICIFGAVAIVGALCCGPEEPEQDDNFDGQEWD